LHLRAIVERSIPLASSLRCQIQTIPNWIEFVDAALFDIGGQPGVTTVKMPQGAVTLSSENRDCRILTSFAIFAAEIVFEGAFAGTQQTQFLPTSISRVGSEGRRIGGS